MTAGTIFDPFLDADWQYSRAYFEPRDISLDDARLAKKRHVAAKLLLEPGNRVPFDRNDIAEAEVKLKAFEAGRREIERVEF